MGLREQWRKICLQNRQNPYQQFLDEVGDKAEYKHIALDSYALNRKRIYGTQPYIVFEHKARTVFTFTDLEALANHAKNHRLPSVRSHMAAQLEIALRDYAANEKVIAGLSPHKNRPRAVFAR